NAWASSEGNADCKSCQACREEVCEVRGSKGACGQEGSCEKDCSKESAREAFSRCQEVEMTVPRPPAGSIPTSPGSYQFKDEHGRVIYVGKAANLRNRVSNYFQDVTQLHPRTASMVTAATSVEWIEVRNEVEALILEYSLIKQHRPRFNVRLRDDKSYPFLAVTLDEEYPRAVVMRGTKRKGTKYFGPFPHAWAIRDWISCCAHFLYAHVARANSINITSWGVHACCFISKSARGLVSVRSRMRSTRNM
ncbi:MAG: UvrABC system protein, partial [Actinomycetota bacterium]